MPKKQTENREYKELMRALREGGLKSLYVFYGEEKYLMEYAVGELRKRIPQDTEEFNHRRFDGRGLSIDELNEAVEALPVFAEHTLIEVNDFDFGRTDEETREKLIAIFSDMPEYCWLVFICDTVEYKLDQRIKANKTIGGLITAVEFRPQEQDELTKWIARHFAAAGKRITRQDAEHLAVITGGLMTALDNEIEKVASYAKADTVTREDIDAVVTPVVEATVYELVDAIVDGRRETAMRKLADLLSLDFPAHRIAYSLSLKMRQLMGARLYIDAGQSVGAYMKDMGIKYAFQARNSFAAARKLSLQRLKEAAESSAKAAYKLNSANLGDRSVLTELIVSLTLTLDPAVKR